MSQLATRATLFVAIAIVPSAAGAQTEPEPAAAAGAAEPNSAEGDVGAQPAAATETGTTASGETRTPESPQSPTETPTETQAGSAEPPATGPPATTDDDPTDPGEDTEANAADEKTSPWRIDGGLVFSRFEQQVKSEIGGARGERLVEDTELGLNIFATYNIWWFISAGLFFQFDVGSRSAADLESFDAASGAPNVINQTGGSFLEIWLGPLLRLHWWRFFAEVGWAPLGLRRDTARTDLPAADGNTTGMLQTTPGISWLFAVGGGVPITDDLHLVIRMEYRLRYYTKRGGQLLRDEIAHGTQNFTPFMGVAWFPG